MHVPFIEITDVSGKVKSGEGAQPAVRSQSEEVGTVLANFSIPTEQILELV